MRMAPQERLRNGRPNIAGFINLLQTSSY